VLSNTLFCFSASKGPHCSSVWSSCFVEGKGICFLCLWWQQTCLHRQLPSDLLLGLLCAVRSHRDLLKVV
jgi:hypothetical protein